MSILVISLIVALAAQQVPPPNLVENGDARGGASGWQRQRGTERAASQLDNDAFIETRDGAPCFVMRNQASWIQHVGLHEDYAGKFLLLIARASSERVHPDGNITGLPYLWARVMNGARPSNANVFQGMSLRSKTPDEWGTIHGIFRMPQGARAITIRLGQAQRRGTPQNGSAARIKEVEMRLFNSRTEAEAYVARYTAFHDPEAPALKRLARQDAPVTMIHEER